MSEGELAHLQDVDLPKSHNGGEEREGEGWCRVWCGYELELKWNDNFAEEIVKGIDKSATGDVM